MEILTCAVRITEERRIHDHADENEYKVYDNN